MENKLNNIVINGNVLSVKKYTLVFYVRDFDLFNYNYETCNNKGFFSYSTISLQCNEQEKDNAIWNFHNKHSNYLLKEIIENDIEDILWLDGYILKTNSPKEEILSLIEMGEEMYLKSAQNTNESYLVDLDYRLSLIELGLVGEGAQ